MVLKEGVLKIKAKVVLKRGLPGNQGKGALKQGVVFVEGFICMDYEGNGFKEKGKIRRMVSGLEFIYLKL